MRRFAGERAPATTVGLRAESLKKFAGRAWAYILRARSGPGLKNIKHIGFGPGLGLV